ncbi:hypothetical protein R70006_06289 [Paraburkholderia domus]|uniref:hypothetical protein n=1 Tax=Paraburkholderia domus TaxID=2793075 RepID=UPI00191436C0|nr:hypothetical protein [Paraburkholderia domus]MBK5052919.1 hypothetical protein [Burkholderia sp. R-70006]CAE6822882.1 hypothetical protein R70006_06289 [Paraburkholderia domus]
MDFEFSLSVGVDARVAPVYDGVYRVRLKGGREERIAFVDGQWEWDPQEIVSWRGQRVRFKKEDLETLRRVVHSDRFANDKKEARRAALWLARRYVIRAEETASPVQEMQARRNACGWYQIAGRLGVSFTEPSASDLEDGAASRADAQALERNWTHLPEIARERIMWVADRFADGSGDRLVFD